MFFFFFSSRRRHTRSLRDWSSDVCSSDLSRWAPRMRSVPSSTRVLKPEYFSAIRRDEYQLEVISFLTLNFRARSEERRVGKECRCRWWRYYYKKKRRYREKK